MTYSKFDFDNDSHINAFSNDTLENQISSLRSWFKTQKKHYVNAYYNGTPFSWAQIMLNIDYSNGNFEENQDINNDEININSEINTRSYQNYDLYATKVTMKSPLWGGDLLWGGEYSYTKTKQNFDVINNSSETPIETDDNLARQNAISPFLSYNKSFNEISANLGLRYENVRFSYYVNHKKIEEQSQTFNNLFPSVDISYSGKVEIMLGYQKSINRPSYWQLRNSIKYSSVYLYEIGNPYLKPTLVNSFSFFLKWKDFHFSANYDRAKDYIALLYYQYDKNPDIILTRFENLNKFQNLSLLALYSTQIKKWQPSLELSLEKNIVHYNSHNFNKPIYTIKFRNSIILFDTFLIGVDIRHKTSGYMDLSYSHNNFRADVYLSKSFLNKKLRINLRGDDIWGTDKWKERTKMNNTFLFVKGDINRRAVSISVSYRFNSTKNKYKGERATDEINRL
jgi:hypothetical protein